MNEKLYASLVNISKKERQEIIYQLLVEKLISFEELAQMRVSALEENEKELRDREVENAVCLSMEIDNLHNGVNKPSNNTRNQFLVRAYRAIVATGCFNNKHYEDLIIKLNS